MTKASYLKEDLKGNVYIEEKGKVHLLHETWKLIIGMNLTSNDERIEAIDTTIQLAESANRSPNIKSVIEINQMLNLLKAPLLYLLFVVIVGVVVWTLGSATGEYSLAEKNRRIFPWRQGRQNVSVER